MISNISFGGENKIPLQRFRLRSKEPAARGPPINNLTCLRERVIFMSFWCHFGIFFPSSKRQKILSFWCHFDVILAFFWHFFCFQKDTKSCLFDVILVSFFKIECHETENQFPYRLLVNYDQKLAYVICEGSLTQTTCAVAAWTLNRSNLIYSNVLMIVKNDQKLAYVTCERSLN